MAIREMTPGEKLGAALWEKAEEEITTLRAQRDEMLEALKAALPFIVNDSPGGCAGEFTDCDHCAAIRMARAAIRKVEGPALMSR